MYWFKIYLLIHQYEAFREELLDTFKPGQIEVTGEGTPTATSWFEVTVNGKLIHSKKNGDGYVDLSQLKSFEQDQRKLLYDD
nr:protein phosphatase 1 regulatory subunit 16A [Biomphalaria glabrata]